jgi:serine/alanine adding enzyme
LSLAEAAPQRVRIEIAGRAPAGWDDFVASRPDAPVYLQSRWCQLAADVFGHEPFFCTAYTDGLISGVMPLVRLRTALFGDFMVSLPLFNYGGALATSEGVANQMMEAMGERAQQLGVRHIEFRDREARSGNWQVRTDKVAMWRDLPANEAELGKQLGSKLRSQIRRADREQPKVLVGGAELVRPFYEVFAEGMRSLGTPVYPQRFFETLIRMAETSCRIVVVYIHDRPIAAGWLIFGESHAEVPWAACRPEGKPLSVNMRLYWELLTASMARGARRFDFGRSTVDSGTYRFKKQWGAEPQQLYWHYWLRDGAAMPNLTTHNRKYEMAINVWKRLPLWVTKLAGPVIVRGLP